MIAKHIYLILLPLVVINAPLRAQSTGTSYIVNTVNTPGSDGGFNTFIGPDAGKSNAGGYDNAFVGTQAGLKNTTGAYNAFLGFFAGQYTTTGSFNTFIGADAGLANVQGSCNAFLGAEAGLHNTGHFNTFSGYQAGWTNTTGIYNMFTGFRAGYFNLTGDRNLALGSAAGYTNQTGRYNVMVGDSAGYYNTVSSNVFVGSKAGYTNQTGQKSTLIGFQSGYYAVADSNTFVGYNAGYTTTTGRGNTFFGTASGRGNTTGNHNTFIGNGAGPATPNIDDNIYIGYTAKGDGAIENATAIGAGARVAISNAVVLGNHTNVGIGTSAPAARLEVVSEIADASGLRLSNLTASSQPANATDQFLTVNELGDVVKARYRLKISSTAEWSDNVFAPSYVLSPLNKVEGYVRQYSHLPGVPSADEVVREGVDATRLNATLLGKIEELTLYLIELKKEVITLQKDDKRKRVQLEYQRRRIEHLEIRSKRPKQAEKWR